MKNFVYVVKNKVCNNRGEVISGSVLVGIAITYNSAINEAGSYLMNVPEGSAIRVWDETEKKKFKKNGEVIHGFTTVYGNLVDYYWIERVEALA